MGNWPLKCTVKCAFDIQKGKGSFGTVYPPYSNGAEAECIAAGAYM